MYILHNSNYSKQPLNAAHALPPSHLNTNSPILSTTSSPQVKHA